MLYGELVHHQLKLSRQHVEAVVLHLGCFQNQSQRWWFEFRWLIREVTLGNWSEGLEKERKERIPYLGVPPREKKMHVYVNMWIITAALLIRVKVGNNSNIHLQINRLKILYLYNEILLCNKKKEQIDVKDSLDESQKCNFRLNSSNCMIYLYEILEFEKL